MQDIELLRVLYAQLYTYSNHWREDIGSMNFIVQETHKITGKSRADVNRLVRILIELGMVIEKNRTPPTYEIRPIPLEQLESRLSKGSIATFDTKDLFQLIDLMECRPGMFLIEGRLDYLYMFLSGYKIAANEEHSNLENLEKFTAFLCDKYGEKYRNSMSWYGILNAEFGLGEKGFESFFKDMWEYRLQNEQD